MNLPANPSPHGRQNGFDPKSLIAIGLCLLFYFAYNQYISGKYGDASKSASEHPAEIPKADASKPGTTAPIPAAVPAASTNAPAAAAVTKLTPADLTFATALTEVKFSQDGASLVDFELKNYKETQNPDSRFINLADHPEPIQGIVHLQNVQPSPETFAAERKGDHLLFTRQDGPWKIQQDFTKPEAGKEYGLGLTVLITNTGTQPLDLNAGVLFHEDVSTQKPESGFLNRTVDDMKNFVVSVNGKVTRTDLRKFCEDPEKAPSGINEKINFIGFDSHYFISAFLPKLEKLNFSLEKVAGTGELCHLNVVVSQPFGMVQPGQTIQIPFQTYMGPKAVEVMAEYEPELKASLDMGMFSVIAHPLLWLIKRFNGMFHNYGVAVIFVTFLLKMAFFPLTKQAAVSMKAMQKFQPEMNRIKEKYKDDQQTQQRELMRFMSQHKINPAKGCLPILPQIPVFFALYRVLSQSIELRHAPFFGWIKDLSAADPFYITPILLGAGMLLQQKLTPATGMDPTQQKIMMLMPLIFTASMISLPSGLVAYMLANTIISIIQQQWLNRKLGTNIPVTGQPETV